MVSDGPLSIGDPKNTFRGPTAEELSKMMSDQFLPTNNVVLDQNVLVINTGDKLALFETGMSSVKRNDDMGRLVANLKQSGIEPADVDAVIPTHAHIDHIGGIMAADGSRNFPNAQIYISQADLEFWTDDKRLGTPAEGSALAARKNLIPNRDRIVFYKDGQEVLPGVQAMHTPGHTVGHTSFVVNSGGKSLFVSRASRRALRSWTCSQPSACRRSSTICRGPASVISPSRATASATWRSRCDWCFS